MDRGEFFVSLVVMVLIFLFRDSKLLLISLWIWMSGQCPEVLFILGKSNRMFLRYFSWLTFIQSKTAQKASPSRRTGNSIAFVTPTQCLWKRRNHSTIKRFASYPELCSSIIAQKGL